MPRSFSFDHFTTAQKPAVSRTLKNKAKQKVSAAEQEATGGSGGLHYGKRHAKTEQLARRKAQTHEEPVADARPSSAAEQRAAPADSSQASEQMGDSPRVEQAIDAGFVPAVPEAQWGQAPPLATAEIASERTVFDVLEDGREQLALLARSVADGARAGLRLTQLCLELGLLAARIGRVRST